MDLRILAFCILYRSVVLLRPGTAIASNFDRSMTVHFGERQRIVMLWQKITLTKSQIDSGAVQRVRKDFHRAYKDAGLPTDASVFVSKRTDPVGDIAIYFSPQAANIAQGLVDSFAGIPCNPPPASEVDVFV